MIDLAVGERCEGPVFVSRDGRRRLDRHAAARIVRRVAGRAGITKVVGPHTLRHAFITAALSWMPGCRCGMCRRRPATPIPGPRCATTAPGSPSTVTPPTSSRRSSPEPPDSPRPGVGSPLFAIPNPPRRPRRVASHPSTAVDLHPAIGDADCRQTIPDSFIWATGSVVF